MRRSPRFRPALLLLALALPAPLAGCGHDPVAPEGFGRFTGRWDSERWEGRGFAVLRGDTLYVVGHRPDPDFYYDERVRFHLPFRGVGDYPVPASRGSLEKIVGGDAGWFPDASGSVGIAAYSAEDRVVRGTVHLEADGPDGKEWRFEDGSFELPVYADFEDVPSLPRR